MTALRTARRARAASTAALALALTARAAQHSAPAYAQEAPAPRGTTRLEPTRVLLVAHRALRELTAIADELRASGLVADVLLVDEEPHDDGSLRATAAARGAATLLRVRRDGATLDVSVSRLDAPRGTSRPFARATRDPRDDTQLAVQIVELVRATRLAAPPDSTPALEPTDPPATAQPPPQAPPRRTAASPARADLSRTRGFAALSLGATLSAGRFTPAPSASLELGVRTPRVVALSLALDAARTELDAGARDVAFCAYPLGVTAYVHALTKPVSPVAIVLHGALGLGGGALLVRPLGEGSRVTPHEEWVARIALRAGATARLADRVEAGLDFTLATAVPPLSLRVDGSELTPWGALTLALATHLRVGL